MQCMNKLKSFWSITKYFLFSSDENIRGKRRLVLGVVVLLLVNVIWVASAELSSVSIQRQSKLLWKCSQYCTDDVSLNIHLSISMVSNSYSNSFIIQELHCHKLSLRWYHLTDYLQSSHVHVNRHMKEILRCLHFHFDYYFFQYIFKGEGYNKPFFTTYFKTSAFVMYLVGFLFYHPWQYQCMKCFSRKSGASVSTNPYQIYQFI